jgi:O-antigen/teichoic acid export membrane protein
MRRDPTSAAVSFPCSQWPQLFSSRPFSFIQSGFQEGYIPNLWVIAGQLIGLTGVVIGVHYRVGLPWLVFAVAGAPAVGSLLNTGYAYFIDKRWLRPRISLVRSQHTRRLLGLGLLFFVAQLAQIIGFQSDNVVIAHVLGASNVPTYAIATRMFSVVTLIIGFITAPLWPAYGEALARGDVRWLSRTVYRSVLVILVICIPINLTLVLAGKWILRIWVGRQIAPSFLLLTGIGLSQSLMAIVTPLSAFLNGINLLGRQAICFSLMALTNITVSVYLTRRIGVPGVIYGSVIAVTLFMLFPFIFMVKRSLIGFSSRWERGIKLSTQIARD